MFRSRVPRTYNQVMLAGETDRLSELWGGVVGEGEKVTPSRPPAKHGTKGGGPIS